VELDIPPVTTADSECVTAHTTAADVTQKPRVYMCDEKENKIKLH